jgi:predicted ATPase
MVRLTHEKGMLGFFALATCDAGAALAMLGQVQEGIAQLHKGLAVYRSSEVSVLLSEQFCTLAEILGQEGLVGEGMATLDKAFAHLDKTGERFREAELYRVRAELLRMQGDEGGAEADLHKAIEVARRQQTKSWELRTTTSLARLWRSQGKVDQARQRLAEVYDWFTEGFDTPDLREAKTLLEALSK